MWVCRRIREQNTSRQNVCLVVPPFPRRRLIVDSARGRRRGRKDGEKMKKTTITQWEHKGEKKRRKEKEKEREKEMESREWNH